MSVPSSAPLTQALVALVQVATEKPTGEGAPPVATDPPFAIVYPLPSSGFWGPDYGEAQAGAALAYQITSVGVDRESTEELADTIRHALLDRTDDGAFVTAMPVTGLAVLDRELDSYGGLVEERGAYNVADVFTIHVTR